MFALNYKILILLDNFKIFTNSRTGCRLGENIGELDSRSMLQLDASTARFRRERNRRDFRECSRIDRECDFLVLGKDFGLGECMPET